MLKIDRGFVTDMLDDPTDTSIVRAVVDLGTSLGLETVAEGVEDQPTLAHLSSIGCTHAQGYVISRPMPAADVLTWCRSRDLEPPEEAHRASLEPTR